jgi:hypothetical protein
MAKEKGCTIIDASDWLLFQGMKAYEYFLGESSADSAMKTGLSTYNILSRGDKIALIGYAPCQWFRIYSVRQQTFQGQKLCLYI